MKRFYEILSPWPRILIIVFGVVLFSVSMSSPASAEGGPVFSEMTPAAGSTAPSFRPEISVYIKDDVDISRAAPVMTVNGVKVTSWFNPTPLKPGEGRVVCYPSYQSADLPVGITTVTVTYTDSLGRTGTASWSFNVQNGPQITNFTPGFYSEVYTRPFIIRADVKSTVGIKSVTMTLDGQPLRTTYTNFQICYNPTLWDPVVPNGPHTVRVFATDNAGISNTATWRFTCEFWGDDDNSNVQCTGCHTGFPTPNHPITGHCPDCHSTIPVLSQISWQPGYTHDPGYISAWDCQYCHDPRFAVPLHPADITAYHNTTTDFSSCSNCHVPSLTGEHSTREDPLTGKLYDCTLCHNSTAAQVVIDAVYSKDKRCEACHGSGANHEAAHDTPGQLDSNCGICHINNLTREHQSNPVTQSENLTCGTCHDATVTTNSAVYQAINMGNIQCAACHSLGHKMNLAVKINTEIPLYEGFSWSQPVSAAIFGGEPWMPAELAAAGKIVFSGRRSSVDGDAVFNFYNDALVAQGWVLETPPPQAEADFFTAKFTKGKYKALILFDDRENHITTSPLAASGFRITIIFN